jgi:transposase
VAIQRVHQPVEQRSFPNNPIGHKALIVWLRKAKSQVRVSLEATGIYSLDLAFALDAAEGIEVAVLNPKVANRFAQTIRRSKTDAADAEVLAEYARRMPFTAWVAPSLGSMRLRSIVRHVESLSVQSAQNQNRLHAAQGLHFHTRLHCSRFRALRGIPGASYPQTSARSNDTRPTGRFAQQAI